MGIFFNKNGQPKNLNYARSRLVDRNIDELIGLCKGVIFDGVVEQSEAAMLLQWLETNRHAADKWPANILYARISDMLQDGVLDHDEQAELLDLICQITGPASHLYDTHSTSTDLPLTKPAPAIIFDKQQFCVTGQFITGSRNLVTDLIKHRGGLVKKAPTKTTNYLVIGEIGSRDWIHSTFGRKIEKAIELNQQGYDIAIISEEHWISCIE